MTGLLPSACYTWRIRRLFHAISPDASPAAAARGLGSVGRVAERPWSAYHSVLSHLSAMFLLVPWRWRLL
jgi:hypothetical protein